LATDSLIGGMRGGQGWPPRAGSGAPWVYICRSSSLPSAMLPVFALAAALSATAPGSWALAPGRVMSPARAPRMAAAWSWASAVRTVCRQIPFQDRLSDAPCHACR
jgi:hypothetical protein